jgi:hypothetical protein
MKKSAAGAATFLLASTLAQSASAANPPTSLMIGTMLAGFGANGPCNYQTKDYASYFRRSANGNTLISFGVADRSDNTLSTTQLYDQSSGWGLGGLANLHFTSAGAGTITFDEVHAPSTDYALNYVLAFSNYSQTYVSGVLSISFVISGFPGSTCSVPIHAVYRVKA